MSRFTVIALAILASCGTRSPPVAVAPASGECRSCHVEETRTWEVSLHHRSFTDRDFQASFAREREPFCVGCHAPAATNADDPRVADGVSCVACHATTGGAHPTGPAKRCESCHDFSDPDGILALQKTGAEHARSTFRDVTCAGCHMKVRDHGFAASRDLDRLRAAVSLDAAMRADTLDVTVRPRRIGHAFPTGDLFRRVRVVAFRETLAGRIVATDERSFERTFEPGAGHRREHSDGRIDGETRFTLDLGAPSHEPTRVIVQLLYERGAARSGDDLALFSSDVLDEKTLKGPE